VAAEGDDDVTRDGQRRDFAIGAHRRAADEHRAVRRLEEQLGVLDLADRPGPSINVTAPAGLRKSSLQGRRPFAAPGGFVAFPDGMW
jgi:hypothetical protein